MASATRIVVKDSSGITFDPSSLPHQYTRDTAGNMLTDTCTEAGSIVRVKTYTYEEIGGAWCVQTESAWVVQNPT